MDAHFESMPIFQKKSFWYHILNIYNTLSYIVNTTMIPKTKVNLQRVDKVHHINQRFIYQQENLKYA